MNWTEPQKPNRTTCYYDHVTCETPLGRGLITWKSWKEYSTYGAEIENDYVGNADTLEEAKQLVYDYLTKQAAALLAFLGTDANHLPTKLTDEQDPITPEFMKGLGFQAVIPEYGCAVYTHPALTDGDLYVSVKDGELSLAIEANTSGVAGPLPATKGRVRELLHALTPVQP